MLTSDDIVDPLNNTSAENGKHDQQEGFSEIISNEPPANPPAASTNGAEQRQAYPNTNGSSEEHSLVVDISDALSERDKVLLEIFENFFGFFPIFLLIWKTGTGTERHPLNWASIEPPRPISPQRLEESLAREESGPGG